MRTVWAGLVTLVALNGLGCGNSTPAPATTEAKPHVRAASKVDVVHVESGVTPLEETNERGRKLMQVSGVLQVREGSDPFDTVIVSVQQKRAGKPNLTWDEKIAQANQVKAGEYEFQSTLQQPNEPGEFLVEFKVKELVLHTEPLKL